MISVSLSEDVGGKGTDVCEGGMPLSNTHNTEIAIVGNKGRGRDRRKTLWRLSIEWTGEVGCLLILLENSGGEPLHGRAFGDAGMHMRACVEVVGLCQFRGGFLDACCVLFGNG